MASIISQDSSELTEDFNIYCIHLNLSLDDRYLHQLFASYTEYSISSQVTTVYFHNFYTNLPSLVQRVLEAAFTTLPYLLVQQGHCHPTLTKVTVILSVVTKNRTAKNCGP